MTLPDEAIRAAASQLEGSSTPKLDARVLMRFVLQADDATLIAQADVPLTKDQKERFDQLIAQRRGGAPIAYLTSVQEFWSLPFEVTPDVLIPRPDSECLIETVLRLKDKNEPWRVLDLGTGSGCLLCTLLVENSQATGLGVDISDAAIQVAERNAKNLELGNRTQFLVSDWTTSIDGRFDVIIVNAPYIKTEELRTLSREVVDHEPHGALFSGESGLDDYRKIAQNIGDLLAGDGILVAECAIDQTSALAEIFTKALPEARCETILDMTNRPRGVVLQRQ